MSEAACVKAFSGRLIAWQEQWGRHDLPWQQTQDAYRVWLAEIMLQPNLWPVPGIVGVRPRRP